MARYNANSLLNSLRGKIWLATSAMAFFICIFGLISYLLVSFVIDDTFYAIFIPILILAFGLMVFGWWLSNELVTPIEKIGMLAQSLERSATTSLPKTTGSIETDELLQTLHRNSRQINNLVSLMDEVANGHTDVALSPLHGSDRLIGSFQKLLAKVSESIDAKEELERIKGAVDHIAQEVAPIRRGNLGVIITAEYKETKEISETLRFLVNNLTEIVSQIRNDSERARTDAQDFKQTLQGVITKKQSRVVDLSAAVAELREIPIGIQRIIDDLAKAEELGKSSVDIANRGNKLSARNRDQLGTLRKQLHEAVGRVGRLTERSQEVSKIAKTVEDLAHRTNMIALNASIQAGEVGDRAAGFSAVTDEIGRLAERADNTNKQISAINKSINVEIAEVERALAAANKQISDISQGVLETAGVVTEVEKNISQFLNLQKNVNLKSHEQAAKFETAYRAFESQIGESESILNDLKHSEQTASTMLSAIKNIENSATAFKLVEAADEEMPGELLARYLSEVNEPEPETADVI